MNSTTGSGPKHLQWHKACLQTLQEQTDKASLQDDVLRAGSKTDHDRDMYWLATILERKCHTKLINRCLSKLCSFAQNTLVKSHCHTKSYVHHCGYTFADENTGAHIYGPTSYAHKANTRVRVKQASRIQALTQ